MYTYTYIYIYTQYPTGGGGTVPHPYHQTTTGGEGDSTMARGDGGWNAGPYIHTRYIV